MWRLRKLKRTLLNPTTIFALLLLNLLRLFSGASKYDFYVSLIQHKHPRIWRAHKGVPVGKSLVFCILPNWKKFIGRVKDSFPISDIYDKEVYDRLFKPQKGQVIVDIGAHVGIYTVKAASEVGENGVVIAIDPCPVNYQLLKYNIKLNKLSNVLPLNVAIMNYNGKTKLYLFENAGRLSSTKISGEQYITVPCKRLDGLLNELGIKNVDLIKIDVEGAELDVLEGSWKIPVKRFVIAAYHDHVVPQEAKKVSQFLSSRAYKTLTIDKYVYAEAL